MSNITHRSGGNPGWTGGGPRWELLCNLFGILAVGVHLAYTVIPGQATERQCYAIINDNVLKHVIYLYKNEYLPILYTI